MDESLEDLPVSQRNCFLKNERKLKLFKIYTQKNCEIECYADMLLKTCGCVPFFIIRTNETRICELYDYVCINKKRHEIILNGNLKADCSCLQTCNSISYKLETIETKHQREKTGGRIRIKFKDNEFISMHRVRQFTIFDFLSYIGGLLGLFAGISVLSLFEIFYFFTLRLICEILVLKRRPRRVGCGHSVLVVAPRAVK